MRRLLLTAVTAAALAAPRPAAADPPKRVDPSAAADVQDVVYFGARPVVMRLHILVDGRPYSEAWESYVKKRFAYADRDENGTLDKDEVKLLPSAVMFQQMVLGGNNYFNLSTARMEDVDADEDGKVTLAELREYYRKGQASALKLVVPPTSGTGANALTEALFRHLDRNKDGKISKEELVGADQLIARLDSNDDETLDAPELLGGQAMAQPGRPVVLPPAVPGLEKWRDAAPANSSFFLVPREKAAGRLTERLLFAKRMLAHYDKDRSGKLTREEIGLDEELFKKLDRNGDRVLDAIELLRYIVLAPDVEVTIHIGKRGDREAAVQVTPGSRANLVKSLGQASDGLTLSMRSAQIDLRRTDSVTRVFQRSTQFAEQLFRQLDPTNKGVVVIDKTLEKIPRLAYLRVVLEMADREGAGKVTKKQFVDLMELQNEAANCTLTISVSEFGQGLFEMMDANRDGRLSVRELRAAWQRLSAYDHNGDGAIESSEIPFQYQILVGAGTMNPGMGQQPSNPYAPRPVVAPTAGPMWFRKMDRNGDGDVSQREFLGSPEEFKKLDEDGDGFISLEEALRADARLRQKTAKKR